jgi:N-acetylglucosaminyl-diphospho-decaprenol L-rhamnosyltransferase
MSLRHIGNIAVIVVTWNSAEVIEQLLTSIGNSDVNATVRLIVVDNASCDNTVALVRGMMPDAEVIQNGRNAGFAGGVNAGIALARESDAYLLLNPDIRLERNTVQLLLDESQASGAGIVVPKLVDEFGGLRLSLRREPTVLRAWGEALLGGRFAGRHSLFGEVETRPTVYERPGRADWATGAAMLISRECAASVGQWDESFFLYSEETDFSLRARDAGFELRFVPAAKAVHFEGESEESTTLFSLLVRNRVKLYRSRHGAVPTAAFWAGVLVGELIRLHRPPRRAAARALLGRTSGVAGPT